MPAATIRKNTPLRAGYAICFDPRNKCLMLFDEAGVVIPWANSDDKKLVGFITSKEDFADLALLLAEMRGLRIERAFQSVGYRFKFFE